MTDLSALIARVEEGTDGPDYELDRDIGLALGLWRPVTISGHAMFETADEVFPDHPGAMRPSLLESLDAVLSLIEQKLPGWCPDVGKVPPFALAPDDYEWTGALMGNEREVTYGHGEPPEMAFDTYNGHANSGARALLAATLRALSALEDSKADLADANTKGPSHDA